MKRIVFTLFIVTSCIASSAQRLSVGGYGEAVFSRNYFSDHVSRYSQPEEHKNDPSHGRFDMPSSILGMTLARVGALARRLNSSMVATV